MKPANSFIAGNYISEVIWYCHVQRMAEGSLPIEVDAETKDSTRKTEEKLDGRYKEGHERKKRKRRPVGR
jgi:hypothetical protein